MGVVLTGCSSTSDTDATTTKSTVDYEAFETPDRTAQSHSSDVDPDFDEVFANDEVKRLDIVVSAENWETMQEDMTQLYGEPGVTWQDGGWDVTGGWQRLRPEVNSSGAIVPTGDSPRWPPPTSNQTWEQVWAPPQDTNPPTEDGVAWPPPTNTGFPREDGTGAFAQRGWWGWPGGAWWAWWGWWETSFSDEDPVMVEADVFYEWQQWYKIGIRYKGNSSLMSTRSSGNGKLSFKLDFDEYEDEYPWIKNQRFFGFKKLSLKNNFSDASIIREKVASDIFADAGLAVSHTALYEVYVDYGEGPVYFGVYTLVEEVDDTVIKTQFSDDGNLYKPDGAAASFAEGSYNEDQYVKKNNESKSDYSDVAALLEAVNDDRRITDPVTWRANLDAIFDTDVFLHYLAINTTIQNRDTYGSMTHNYFLYNDPDTGKLTWIPRDNNESLQAGKRGDTSLNFASITGGEWPLIEYLYADDVYRAIYEQYLQETIDGPFAVETMQAKYDYYADLVEPYALAEQQWYSFLNGDNAFAAAISSLKQHVVDRVAAVQAYLDS